MRSPLETINGAFDHAVFTTYSINLHFFEHWVLPLLRRCEVRNVIVLADHAQFGAALQDRRIRAAGRSYQAASIRIGPGAFHPKLIYLSGETTTKVCVSSGNLTVDGQLRNLEAGIVLESTVPAHRSAINDVADFIRRISAFTPPPTAEAILTALSKQAAGQELPSLRLLHNLDQPLIEQLPPANHITAVTPYADDGYAASRLATDNALTVITDGRSFAAPPSFFTGPWQIDARKFHLSAGTAERHLHGKAYWSVDGDGHHDWLLLGSPNLSRPALCQVAQTGNTEVAVLVPTTDSTFDPGGEGWDGPPIAEAAPRRQRLARQAEGKEPLDAFNAWEDSGTLRTDLALDTPIEHWDGEQWLPLGFVVQGQLQLPAEVRPYLIRTADPTHPRRHAVVLRTAQLRQQRLRPRVTSRSADVASNLPLDLQGVKALEEVLADLYLLDSIAQGEIKPTRASTRPGEGEELAGETFSDWVPADAHDEPRVPALYRDAWQQAPDALLALVRHALRLDPTRTLDDDELRDETLDIEDQEDDEGIETPPATPPTPRVQSSTLKRYRGALMKLMERAVPYVASANDQAVADLAFQYVLRLHEQLADVRVTVDDSEVPLVEPAALLRQDLRLLEAYLTSPGSDQACLATARFHLANCLARQDTLEPQERERLEALAYRVAGRVLTPSKWVAAAARDTNIPEETAIRLVKPYADRTDWSGFAVQAELLLDYVDIGDDPLPWVSGEDYYIDIDASPAWRLIGYGAIVGFRTQQPYAALVENAGATGSFTYHVLLADPPRQCLYEAARRRADGNWLIRTYRPMPEHLLDEAGELGPLAITRHTSRSVQQATADDIPQGLLRTTLSKLGLIP